VADGFQTDIEQLSREIAPQVLGTLVSLYRDFAAAEDALQEALLAAAVQWPREGAPDNPRAWLTQVACRRMTDEIRSRIARRNREGAVARELDVAVPPLECLPDEDDTLMLIRMCRQPALTPASAIALTLRAVGGLTTAEIARAFLVPEATMAQRISRAKQTIRNTGACFQLPDAGEQPASLRNVLQVLYLIFNEGYTASGGDQLQRTDLAGEAIRLARLVHAKAQQDAEVEGLLALMLLTEARRHARSGMHGDVIPLDQQDRTLWDRALITEGVELLSRALKRGAVGPYQLQAAIAAVHDEANSSGETDWPQIVALYELLLRMADNPMVRLNHAVAIAITQGPEHGLALLEQLGRDDEVLRNHHRLHAVRAHLYEMTGDIASAIENYQKAAMGSASLPERNYLLTRAAELRKSRRAP
jgi:RNA polymerase sigma factor (sigma-70 family)